MLTTALPNTLFNEETQIKLLNALYCCANGVLGMSADIPDLVETSSNLARVSAKHGTIEILTSQRKPRSGIACH